MGSLDFEKILRGLVAIHYASVTQAPLVLHQRELDGYPQHGLLHHLPMHLYPGGVGLKILLGRWIGIGSFNHIYFFFAAGLALAAALALALAIC